MKSRKAPPGMDLIMPTIQEFEIKRREALDTPPDEKRRNEITWPMHKLHYQYNRYLYDMHYRERRISKQLLDYLIHEKLADGRLISKWRRPGYERLCSLQVITKSNTAFGTVGVCRIPLHERRGQILPNVLTGCVSCASGDGGPIWWDDPVPDIVKERIQEIDPGKAELADEDLESSDENDDHTKDEATSPNHAQDSSGEQSEGNDEADQQHNVKQDNEESSSSQDE